MKKFFYVLQHKIISNKATGKVVSNQTYLIGYNLNEKEKNDNFYSFNKTEKHTKSSIQYDEDGYNYLIQNAYGCHSKKYKNDNEA